MKPEQCIFFLANTAGRGATRYWKQRVAAHGVTAVQGMLLNFLLDEDGIGASALARRTHLDAASLTGVLDRLEVAGLLRRAAQPGDRRAQRILLTESGRALAEQIQREVEAANEDFLARFSAEEVDTLRGLLKRLQP